MSYILNKISWDKDFANKIKLCDMIQYDMYADELLGPWFHSEDDSHKYIFSTIASSVIRSNTKVNGKIRFMTAFGKIDKNQHYSESQLKILLQSSNVIEVCKVMRNMLRQIEAGKFHIDYERLLDQLIFFNTYPDRQKISWAKDYYSMGSKK